MATSALAWENKFSTTLSAGITASDTTIPLNALPAGNEGFLVIEPDSSTNFEIIYYTSKTSSEVVCPSVGAGRGQDGTSAVSHSSGATVKMLTVAAMFENLQNGTAFSAGAVIPNHLISGAGTNWVWQSYTPTWTGFTIGNGTQNNDYTQIGKTVIVRINVVLGSTSSMSSNPTFTLPVTAVSDYTSAAIPAGSAFFEDVGVAGYIAFPSIRTTTTCVVEALSAGGTYLSTASVSSTAPFTWGTGDKIQATIIYEAL